MHPTLSSEIARDLEVSGQKTRYDASARRLVAQKSILAYILKSTMDEFKDVSVKQIAETWIEGAPQVGRIAVHQDSPDKEQIRLSGSDRLQNPSKEDVSSLEGTVRYDIHFAVRLPQQQTCIEIIVNIEVQNNDTPGYPIVKRGIYYASRMISAQRGRRFKDQEYDKIQKVVSIWICENTAMRRSDSVNEYCFLEKCRRGTYQEDMKNYDLIRVIILRLGLQGEQSDDDAVRLLSNLFSAEKSPEEKKAMLSNEFHIAMTEEISQEVENMCNLSTGILEKGIEKGFEQGLEQGKEKGREEGALAILCQLVKSEKCTMEEAAQLMHMEVSNFEQQYRAYWQSQR